MSCGVSVGKDNGKIANARDASASTLKQHCIGSNGNRTRGLDLVRGEGGGGSVNRVMKV